MKFKIIILVLIFVTSLALTGCDRFDFNERNLKLEVEIVGQGKVEPTEGVFKKGDIVEFKVSAEEGWSFYKWEGPVSDDNTIVMESDTKVTAFFQNEKIEISEVNIFSYKDLNDTIEENISDAEKEFDINISYEKKAEDELETFIFNRILAGESDNDLYLITSKIYNSLDEKDALYKEIEYDIDSEPILALPVSSIKPFEIMEIGEYIY
ncbi:MAG: InlB B-repeat-containing protein [Bacillota bacterium]